MSTDLAVLDVADVELASDPAAYVITACERAKTWLAHALEHGGIEQIVEMKSQAEAIRVYTMSKQLGKDAALSAAEVVRRAERGIGLAIRRGQEAGDIRRSGQTDSAFPDAKSSPQDYFAGGQEQTDTYAMADNVTDEQFDDAIAEARSEGNLSRANLVRKVRAKREAADIAAAAEPEREFPDPDDRTGFANMQRRAAVRAMAAEGYTSKQIGEKLGRGDGVIRQMAREMAIKIPADEALGKGVRRIDPNRVVRETAQALEGLAMGIGLIIDDLSGLDPDEVANWAASLTESARTLNRLIKALKEKAQ